MLSPPLPKSATPLKPRGEERSGEERGVAKVWQAKVGRKGGMVSNWEYLVRNQAGCNPRTSTNTNTNTTQTQTQQKQARAQGIAPLT